MGIDLQWEVCENGTPTSRLLSLQVKSGPSHFNGSTESHVNFYFRDTHKNYWLNHSLPVILVLHNTKTDETIWQRVTDETVEKTPKRWKVKVPFFRHDFF